MTAVTLTSTTSLDLPHPRPSAAHRALVWIARAAVLAHAAFTPISIAGMQIALGTAFGALVLLRLGGFRVWARSVLDAPALLVSGAAVLSIALATLAGSPPAGWHSATLWRSFLAPLVIVSALAVSLPGEDQDAVRRRAMWALFAWAAAATLASVVAWIQVPTGIDPLQALGIREHARQAAAPRYPGRFAAVGFFWWYTVFAQNLTPPLAVAAGVVLYGRLARRARALLAIAVLAATSAVALSFSRAAWVALALAAAMLVVLGGRLFARKALPITVAAFVALTVAHPGLRNRLIDAAGLSHNADRVQIWGVCAAIVRDYPVTGIGWGNIRSRGAEYYERFTPWAGSVRTGCHNVFYTVLAEGGPMLLLAAVLYWGLLFRGFWRRRAAAQDPLARAAASGAIAATLGLLLNGMWHDVFYSSEPMYGLGVALGIAAALSLPRGAPGAPPS